MERFAAVLRSAAPDGRGDPSIVVLGDGFENDAQWEISDVAFRLGVPMVTLDDLRQREGRVYAHVDGRRREVDVIYRRSNYHLLRDEDGSPSALAEKLLEPIRRGTVTVVNPPGVGIADDKLAHAYVEDMIRFYLDEEPVIAPARSYDLTDDDAREDALGRLGEMVVKVRDRVGGEGVLIGEEAEGAREDIEARPQDFIAQELVELSRHPTLFDGELSPRRIDLRPLIAYDGGERRDGARRAHAGRARRGLQGREHGPGRRREGDLDGRRMSAAKTIVTAARAAANNRAVRGGRGDRRGQGRHARRAAAARALRPLERPARRPRPRDQARAPDPRPLVGGHDHRRRAPPRRLEGRRARRGLPAGRGSRAPPGAARLRRAARQGPAAGARAAPSRAAAPSPAERSCENPRGWPSTSADPTSPRATPRSRPRAAGGSAA